jgi:hypothetical protein
VAAVLHVTAGPDALWQCNAAREHQPIGLLRNGQWHTHLYVYTTTPPYSHTSMIVQMSPA